MSDLTNQTLHQFLTRRYDLEGLKTLCLYLEVDYDNLDGRTKDSLARELIRHMARVGREGELIALHKKREAMGQKPSFSQNCSGHPGLYDDS